MDRYFVRAQNAWFSFREGEEGQTLVEYALIISLIAVVAIGMLTLTGNNINGILNSIANAL